MLTLALYGTFSITTQATYASDECSPPDPNPGIHVTPVPANTGLPDVQKGTFADSAIGICGHTLANK